MSQNKVDRMKELSRLLTEASEAYYAKNREIMSNFEYDALYDELEQLEALTGIVLSGSPTQKVGYEAVQSLPKERHASPMLSLAKTKDREELANWLLGKEGVLSWKLDGLTVVLTYEGGALSKAVTRGNGEVGEVITANAKCFDNIPLTIPYKGTLTVRGEAVIGYSDFEKLNAEIEEVSAKYKNPRNLCSGSVRQLQSEITAKRHVQFVAFSFVDATGQPLDDAVFNDRMAQFAYLKDLGFTVVEHYVVTKETILDQIDAFAKAIETYDIPSDGLVLSFRDIAYGKSLGRTAKFPRDSIAFKWADEIAKTTLLEIEWSPSRTGLINPVAIFEPVELEGTTVSRASVHNISIVESLALGIGDEIEVYKANMIIPQIAQNLTRSGTLAIPERCPACGGKTQIRAVSDAKALYCTNPECSAKHIKAFTLFVSRDAMNIDGLSEATLEKFIAKGFVRSLVDLFHLDAHMDEIMQMEGFGAKSYQNLIGSIQKAKQTTLPRLIYALGIPGIGVQNAKMICKHFAYDANKLAGANMEELAAVDGVGPIMANAFASYFASEKNRKQYELLLDELTLEVPASNLQNQTLDGKVFVITGSVNHFANRSEVKEVIEGLGGKVTGSVTSNTDYLINNDVNSTSGKNKKAKELGVAIISEEEFMTLAGIEG